LIAASSSAPPVIASEAKQSWAFFDPDYRRLIRWKKALGSDPLLLGPRLDATAHRLKAPFLEVMSDLGRKHDSLAWWISRVSERNPMISPLFLRCCYLMTAIEMLDTTDGDLLIGTDSPALARLIARAAMERRWEVESAPARPKKASALRRLFRVAAFLRRHLRRPRRMASSMTGRPSILMRTWVDEVTFAEDGELRDRYYGRLAAWLESQGATVTTIPVLANITRGDAAAWSWLDASSRRFLDPRAFITWRDLFSAIRACAAQRRFDLDEVKLDGVNVAELFDEERQETLFDGGSLEAALWYELPRHLAARGDRIDAVIDLYENMITEKPLILGFRRWFPTTKLIGYQHGVPAPLLVSIFVSAAEAGFAPLPDRIVTSGAPFTRFLTDAGMPADRVVTGPALRYEYLTVASDVITRGDAVLLTLPLPESDAIELLVKAEAAFAGEDVQVLVKPHPMGRLDDLLAAAGMAALPAGWERAGGSMQDALARSRVVVTLASATSFEAAAAGALVVAVGRDATFEQNPMQWFPGLARTVYSSEEIRGEVRRLLALNDAEARDEAARGAALLRGSFQPVDDASLAQFLVN
jgi:hypothetical protein